MNNVRNVKLSGVYVHAIQQGLYTDHYNQSFGTLLRKGEGDPLLIGSPSMGLHALVTAYTVLLIHCKLLVGTAGRSHAGSSAGRFFVYKKWTFLCIILVILEHACPS